MKIQVAKEICFSGSITTRSQMSSVSFVFFMTRWVGVWTVGGGGGGHFIKYIFVPLFSFSLSLLWYLQPFYPKCILSLPYFFCKSSVGAQSLSRQVAADSKNTNNNSSRLRRDRRSVPGQTNTPTILGIFNDMYLRYLSSFSCVSCKL